MEARLIIEFDREGDILHIGKVAPYAEQDSHELDYGLVARRNPNTGEIENLEILFFSKRAADGGVLRLPVLAEFREPGSA